MTDQPEIGKQTSYVLTELRTVLSRSETAIFHLTRSTDPLAPEAVLALEQVADLLDKYRRIGR